MDLTSAESITAVSDRELLDIPAQSTYDLFRLTALSNPQGKALTYLDAAWQDSSAHTFTFFACCISCEPLVLNVHS